MADPTLVQKCCPCKGTENTITSDVGNIPSYTGEFPSPLQVMWYMPENDEIMKGYYPDSEIRTWIKDAADYHGVPHEMLAVILQQENSPAASKWRQMLQFGERSATTFMAVMDEFLLDLVPDKAFGKNLAGGSSGFANMSRATLRGAAEYTEKNYCKNPMPDSVRYRLLGWDQDTRIPGDDWKADLYYCAAHIRQLIDLVTGKRCHQGPLTTAQVREVFKRYNGSGKQADKYASDAMAKLLGASQGNTTLYFYEK